MKSNQTCNGYLQDFLPHLRRRLELNRETFHRNQELQRQKCTCINEPRLHFRSKRRDLL